MTEELAAMSNSPYYVAEIGGKIIGTLVFGKSREDDNDSIGKIGAIYLLPEY